MSQFIILLGGDITVTDRLRAQVRGCPVIAADGGIRHAAALGIENNLQAWVGDFDSSSPNLHARYAALPRHAYATEKDMTDGELAQSLAQEQGATAMVLVGALGGRSDHAFAHLLAAPRSSVPLVLTSGHEEARFVGHELEPDWPVGTEFSVLALDHLSGLSIMGAKWPLDDVEVSTGSGLTISNQITTQLHITCKSGRAMAVAQF